MLTNESAEAFAAEWYSAWNDHDVERVVFHYAPEIVFTTPFAVHGDASLTMRGRDTVAKHVARAFDRVPDLHFEPLSLFVGTTSLVLHYRGVLGLLAAEFMNLDDAGQVERVIAHYSELPTRPEGSAGVGPAGSSFR